MKHHGWGSFDDVWLGDSAKQWCIASIGERGIIGCQYQGAIYEKYINLLSRHTGFARGFSTITALICLESNTFSHLPSC